MHGMLVGAAGLIAGAIVAQAACAAGPSYKLLYSFSCKKCVDGAAANGLVEDSHGNIFGTAPGGKFGAGQAFELIRAVNNQYTYRDIYDFCHLKNYCLDGGYPGPLVLDSHGNLYGVAEVGGMGWGEAFELMPAGNSWQLRRLYSFCSRPKCADGVFPVGPFTYAGAAAGQPYDGKSPLYGMTFGDGSNYEANAFELQPAGSTWQEQVIQDFCNDGNCADYEVPGFVLVADGSGDLYGTLQTDSSGRDGSVFELSPNGDNWTYSTTYNFCSQPNCADGELPSTTLALDSSGSLYGGTQLGGYACKNDGGCGVVYQLGAGSQESVLHTFCTTDCFDGYSPVGYVFLDAAGNVYGTALNGGNFTYNSEGGGTTFEIHDGQFLLLHQFCNQAHCADGSKPTSLIRDPSGKLFGVAGAGGAHNQGAIFEIDF
ncbi:MAG TPA: choice-of-anchor tandem repeat GloVer-containing protein [Rhizomicrobium sp.]|nr:choice-of-anchor tandem repeat GloVer-containing protein [Rhizomicrobium sp.]